MAELIHKMKIIYLASSTIPSQGADAVHVMSICKAFAENGCDVTLIARKSELQEDPFAYYGIREGVFSINFVRRPNIRILGGFIYGWRVKRAFKMVDAPDLIYARSIQALHKLNPKKTPFFFESHWKPQNVLYKKWERSFLRKKNLVAFVFISDGLRSIYVNMFPFAVNKFSVLHDACHIPEKVVQNKNERLQVCYIGSFFKGNGYELIPEMASRMPDIDFHIIGGKEPLLSKLRSHNNLPNLKMHGHVPHRHLAEMYPDFDIMLAPYQKSVPSLQWMSPMKLFEYMSYAKPIISSDFPVIREVLDENNSILVRADCVESWCKAIDDLRDANFRKRLGMNAYNLFVDRFTWSARVKEIIRLYETHLKNTR